MNIIQHLLHQRLHVFQFHIKGLFTAFKWALFTGFSGEVTLHTTVSRNGVQDI